ncbi:hypothetical protein AB0399_38570 [Streptomyces sp. NPDC088194]|uniref:hypothetical protein n=1 Tax=Streptomyces sp. NPDC088194 TaxID=3154931 RepID=UPI00344C2592
MCERGKNDHGTVDAAARVNGASGMGEEVRPAEDRRAPGVLAGEVPAALWSSDGPVAAGAVRRQSAGGPAHPTILTRLCG